MAIEFDEQALALGWMFQNCGTLLWFGLEGCREVRVKSNCWVDAKGLAGRKSVWDLELFCKSLMKEDNPRQFCLGRVVCGRKDSRSSFEVEEGFGPPRN